MSKQTDKIRAALELAANMTELNPVNFSSADVEDSIAEVISVGHYASEAIAALSELEAQPAASEVGILTEDVRKALTDGLSDARLEHEAKVGYKGPFTSQEHCIPIRLDFAKRVRAMAFNIVDHYISPSPSVEQRVEEIMVVIEEWYASSPLMPMPHSTQYEDLRERITKLMQP